VTVTELTNTGMTTTIKARGIFRFQTGVIKARGQPDTRHLLDWLPDSFVTFTK
jgi:hypothetical protein